MKTNIMKKLVYEYQINSMRRELNRRVKRFELTPDEAVRYMQVHKSIKHKIIFG